MKWTWPRSAFLCWILLMATGCYAPMRSPGIPASSLPDEFRMPWRTQAPYSNLALLNAPPPAVYRLGAGDMLEVTVPGLFAGAEVRPLRVQVLEDGTVGLPLLGAVRVGGMSISEAQNAIAWAYGQGVLVNPKVTLLLAEKATVDVVVMGDVNRPGKYPLPRGQNTPGFALAMAEGLAPEAGDAIEIHRRTEPIAPGEAIATPAPSPLLGEPCNWPSLSNVGRVLTIPLRESPFTIQRPIASTSELRTAQGLSLQDISLNPGDVVFVPRKRSEVFYVVGPLDRTRIVNFRLQDRDRELGNGFLLPPDREIDVVTAVTMAGYIDPINSPTTVTVQRAMPDGSSLLIRVDLIAARDDRQETILVQPDDIIYLNPDPAWWMRRTFDRIVADVLMIPYRAAMFRWIDAPNNN